MTVQCPPRMPYSSKYLNWTIETYDSVTSTQDILKTKAENDDVPEGTVILAKEQTKGRGRQGRIWTSPAGNLYLSLLLKPDCSVQDIAQLSVLLSLAVGQTVKNAIPEQKNDIKLKWPNDIIVNGKKSAGILLETSLTTNKLNWVAAGIGININHAPEETGICLNDLGIETITVEMLTEMLLVNISELYVLWTDKGFVPIRQQWLDMSYPPETIVKVGQGETYKSGRFVEIDMNARLVLRDEENKLITVHAADAVLCNAPDKSL